MRFSLRQVIFCLFSFKLFLFCVPCATSLLRLEYLLFYFYFFCLFSFCFLPRAFLPCAMDFTYFLLFFLPSLRLVSSWRKETILFISFLFSFFPCAFFFPCSRKTLQLFSFYFFSFLLPCASHACILNHCFFFKKNHSSPFLQNLSRTAVHFLFKIISKPCPFLKPIVVLDSPLKARSFHIKYLTIRYRFSLGFFKTFQLPGLIST